MAKVSIYILLALLSSKAFSSDCEKFLETKLCYDQYFKTLEEIKSILTFDLVKYDGGEIEDLNGDGVPEIQLVGNGCNKNCDIVLITKEQKGYRMIGRSGGLYAGPRNLPNGVPMQDDLISSSVGYKNIAVLNQSGWAEGVIWHYMYNGHKYISAVSVSYHYEELKSVIHGE